MQASGVKLKCSVTLDGATIEVNSNLPDQTVLCQFLDITNNYEDFALVTLGQTFGTSPRTYAKGTEVVVVASRTSGTSKNREVLRQVVTVGTSDVCVDLNLITTEASNENALGVGSLSGGSSDLGTDF